MQGIPRQKEPWYYQFAGHNKQPIEDQNFCNSLTTAINSLQIQTKVRVNDILVEVELTEPVLMYIPTPAGIQIIQIIPPDSIINILRSRRLQIIEEFNSIGLDISTKSLPQLKSEILSSTSRNGPRNFHAHQFDVSSSNNFGSFNANELSSSSSSSSSWDANQIMRTPASPIAQPNPTNSSGHPDPTATTISQTPSKLTPSQLQDVYLSFFYDTKVSHCRSLEEEKSQEAGLSQLHDITFTNLWNQNFTLSEVNISINLQNCTNFYKSLKESKFCKTPGRPYSTIIRSDSTNHPHSIYRSNCDLYKLHSWNFKIAIAEGAFTEWQILLPTVTADLLDTTNYLFSCVSYEDMSLANLSLPLRSGPIPSNGQIPFVVSYVPFSGNPFSTILAIKLTKPGEYESIVPIMVYLVPNAIQAKQIVEERQKRQNTRQQESGRGQSIALKDVAHWKIDDVYVAEYIASGGGGTVDRGFVNGVAVALKSGQHESVMQSEASVMADYQHESLLGLVGFHYASATHKSSYIVMPLAAGTLSYFYNRVNPPLTYKAAIEGSLQLARGLLYLHNLGVIHRDIKVQNALCVDGKLVLSDFGSAKVFTDSQKLSDNTMLVGTPLYLAPEVIPASGLPGRHESIPRIVGRYSSSVDVFSFGMMMQEVFLKKPPNRSSADAIAGRIPNFPDEFQKLFPSIYELCVRCCAFEPQIRPTMNQVVSALQDMYNQCLSSPEIAERRLKKYN